MFVLLLQNNNALTPLYLLSTNCLVEFESNHSLSLSCSLSFEWNAVAFLNSKIINFFVSSLCFELEYIRYKIIVLALVLKLQNTGVSELYEKWG